jgi:hypothetical protein
MCRLLDSCPGFDFLRADVMKSPSKKMRVIDEMLYELLQKNECSDISELQYGSDSAVNVKILFSISP